MLTSFWKNCWPIIITWQQKNKKITKCRGSKKLGHTPSALQTKQPKRLRPQQ